jgi:hypothetical protein
MSPSVSSHRLWSSARWLIAEKVLSISSHRERGRAENDSKQRAENDRKQRAERQRAAAGERERK